MAASITILEKKDIHPTIDLLDNGFSLTVLMKKNSEYFLRKNFFPISDEKKNTGWDKGKENPFGGNEKINCGKLPPLTQLLLWLSALGCVV